KLQEKCSRLIHFSIFYLAKWSTAPRWLSKWPMLCLFLRLPMEAETLSPLDAVRTSAVLEDCLDQLSILGYIMPVSYKEISDIVKRQKALGGRYEELMSARSENRPKLPSTSVKCVELGQQLQEVSRDLKQANHLFSRTAKQSAMSAENLKKVQADRQHASDVVADTMQELQIWGTFRSLLQAVEREKAKKTSFCTVVSREEVGRKQIKSLQKQLQDVNKEKELELENRNEMIAYLKDQLQEMKAKTDMENRYVKKDTELQVSQTHEKCRSTEESLLNEIEKMRIKTDQEIRVHMEIENFLKQQQMKLEEKLEYWMDKYEKDTESKQQQLNSLKASKAADLATLQELAKQCRLFEQVIIEDRVEKEAARRKVEQDVLEMESVLKLQAWWRGMMVRRFLGPYKILKKLKEEEAAKGKEKGKKDKDKPGAKKKK
uniref:Dynein regulatory complex protein 9 n=1 Tax=Sphenodon punctatus TaxID=8508 RepID=A0A8D0H7B0_SPHPU